MATKKPLSLGVRFPFCRAKCGLCDLPIRCASQASQRQAYAQALLDELAGLAPDLAEHQVTSIRIYGGSANQLGQQGIAELLGGLRSCLDVAPDAEVTLACTPVGLTPGFVAALVPEGLTRIELEEFTFNPLQHNHLAIEHPLETSEETLIALGEAGFGNVGVTLLWGTPGQAPASIDADVEACARLGVSHVTLAPLRLTSGTRVFAQYIKEWAKGLHVPTHVFPNEEEALAIFDAALGALESYGYVGYTRRHFARPDREARYVLERCAGQDVAVLGAGGVCRFDGVTCKNTDDIDAYTQARGDYRLLLVESRPLAANEERAHRVAGALLGTAGVEVSEAEGLGPAVDALREEGLLAEAEGRLALTHLGAFNYEKVLKALGC